MLLLIELFGVEASANGRTRQWVPAEFSSALECGFNWSPQHIDQAEDERLFLAWELID
jgi:hypothetical protein